MIIHFFLYTRHCNQIAYTTQMMLRTGLVCHQPSYHQQHRVVRKPCRAPPLRAGNAGKDVLGGAVDGWLDMASFVSGGSANKSPYSDLAYKIGMTINC